MCGIAGLLVHDAHGRADPAIVGRMTERLLHRGPDDGDVYAEGPIALGHRRLSIIDLSPRGRQPMSNEDGTIWIVFNGEIYDFQALREELVARGHVFRSETDTETILHLYEEHGVAALEKLSGMFAFALWDARERVLLLARDRLGKKPLFYQESGGVLRFASEPRAILADPDVPAEPDPAAIGAYLTLGYVPSPSSAFRGMRKLPPAHYALVRNGRVEVRRYWSLDHQPKRRGSEAELAEELRGLLEDAVRRRLIADVPLGALLSGGIDSSLIVALMRRVGVSRLRTFSIGFDDQRYDELAYARLVAESYETEHEELRVRPDAVELLPRIVRRYGEPFGDSSALPTFLLCEMARRSVTVAIGGDGGDESFAGYDRYLALAWTARLERLPRWMRLGLATSIRRGARAAGPKTLAHRASRLLEGISLPHLGRYAGWMSVFDGGARRRLYTPEFAAAAGLEDVPAALADAFEGPALDLVDQAMRADVRLYLPDDILTKVDVASMAHGLEVRSPLLDHRVVEFAASLPVGMKLRGLEQKVLLRRIARDLLPAPILDRGKMGFSVPIDRWLRCELREMAHDLLRSRRARERGILRSDEVARLLREHETGVAHHHAQLWSLLVLELWYREMIDGTAAPAVRDLERACA